MSETKTLTIEDMTIHYEDGVADERLRIIELLQNEEFHNIVFEKQVIVNGQVYQGWKTKHSITCLGCKQIATIKGNQQ
jgi:hypothetical protein